MTQNTARPSPETGTAQRVRRYQIDPVRSQVRFSTRHLFGLGGVRGSFAIRSGEITLDEDGTVAVAAVIAVNSFDTGNSGRDVTVISARFLDAERFPDITFSATGISHTEAAAAVSGRLTVRTETQPVRLTVHDLDITDDRILATANAEIDRYAFGVTAAKGMAGRRLKVRLSLSAESV
ncbi:YceI family protein [Nakamurella lactea]|uniref:YceI family protein n=1 Tax=Nakamurella lactea TaxID=459515 RepID=UPI000401FEAD|nr:YceI family protein [Nakamurella lactea]